MYSPSGLGTGNGLVTLIEPSVSCPLHRPLPERDVSGAPRTLGPLVCEEVRPLEPLPILRDKQNLRKIERSVSYGVVLFSRSTSQHFPLPSIYVTLTTLSRFYLKIYTWVQDLLQLPRPTSQSLEGVRVPETSEKPQTPSYTTVSVLREVVFGILEEEKKVHGT